MKPFFDDDSKIDLLKAELEFDKVTRQIKEKEHELQKLKVDQYNIKRYIIARKHFLKSLKVL